MMRHSEETDMRTTTGKREAFLWMGQTLLAALFAFAGLAKLSMSADALAAQSGLPGAFLHFIAVCEILGAAGLILPGLVGVKTALTPLAAAGLTIIMGGAVATSAASIGSSAAVMPFVVGIMTTLVARYRWPAGTTRAAIGDARFAE
jgi:hypothetical protein